MAVGVMSMGENQGVSAFPLPPMQYVNNYTDDNIKRGRAPLPPPPPVQVTTFVGFPADPL